MRTRWTLAAIGALALAAVTVGTVVTWRKPVTSANACPADSKAANLDFTLKDVAGQDVSLSQFKGRVLLLDFWATWCGPCKVEIPEFVEFQNRYGPKGLQVVGISVDDTPDKLQPYVAEMKMNYPVLQGLGHDDVQNAYGPFMAIPVTILISRDGKMCATHTGLTSKGAFEQEIKALL
jgi:thiol-disulfide isomerase/thioredoxin